MNLVEYNRIRYAVNVFFFIFVEVCKMFMTDDENKTFILAISM